MKIPGNQKLENKPIGKHTDKPSIIKTEINQTQYYKTVKQ